MQIPLVMPLAVTSADGLALGPPRPMQIPLVMYLMTHAYFCFYHALSNVLLRRVRGAASMMTIMLW